MDGTVPEETLFLSLEIAQEVFETNDDSAGNVVAVAPDEDGKPDGEAEIDDDVESDEAAVMFRDDVFRDEVVKGERGVTVIGEYRESVACER